MQPPHPARQGSASPAAEPEHEVPKVKHPSDIARVMALRAGGSGPFGKSPVSRGWSPEARQSVGSATFAHSHGSGRPPTG